MELSSGTQSIITGALVDFVGHLTALPKRVKAGVEPRYDLHDELFRWADQRGLPLEKIPAKTDWDKTASDMTLEALVNDGHNTSVRIAGALKSYIEFVREAKTREFEEAFVKWATMTGLQIHDPQMRWAAHWWT